MRSLALRSALCLLLASTAISLSRARAGAQTASPQASSQVNRVSAVNGVNARAVAIPGHRPAWASAEDDEGVVPASRTVRLTFALTRAPELEAAYRQLLTDQQTPGSSRYHQWLTPAEIGTQFGPTQHDLDALTAWLRAQGFAVEAVYPSRVFVQVTAPASVVDAALRTELHIYRVGSTTAPAPRVEPSMPAALAPLVEAIVGLAATPMTRDLHKTVHSLRLPAPSGPGGAVRPTLSVPGQNGGAKENFLTPGDFANIYDLPGPSTGINGAGQTIAILGGSRLAAADVAQYETSTGLQTAETVYQPNYLVPPGLADPGTAGLLPNATADDAGDEEEAQLDFNRAYGTAPGATIEMVVAQNWLSSSPDNLTPMFQFVLNQSPRPAVMSVSVSGCEAGENAAANDRAIDSLFSQFALEGISVFFSSGDSGAAGCADHHAAPTAGTSFLAINEFCSTGYVTCVGGTEFADTASPATYWGTANSKSLVSALGYIPEGAWNEPSSTDQNTGATVFALGATGGGPSTIIPKPVWQTGPGVPADGFRDTPDISFSASDHDGYYACLSFNDPGTPAGTPLPNCLPDSGGFFVIFSGTSASAPSMAGVAALIAQKLGGRQGNLNPLLYQLAASTPAAFHDATPASSGVGTCDVTVASMCNNSTPSATGLTGGLVGYPLGPGYDLATGLGSLDVNNLLAALVPVSITGTPGFTLSASVPSFTVAAGATAGNTATLTFTSVNGFAGGVNAMCTVAAITGGLGAPTCLITPGNASLSSGSAQSSTLTVTTIGTSAGHRTETSAHRDAGSLGGELLGGTAAIAGLLCLVRPRRRAHDPTWRALGSTWRAVGSMWRALGCLALLTGIVGAVSGCSSNGAFHSSPPTTKGNYTITITASGTSDGQTNPATATLTIPLTVQ